MSRIKFVGYLFLLFSTAVSALVPVEGILMGDAKQDLQIDPLARVFSDFYDRSQSGENNRIKLYLSSYQGGENLHESCSYLEAPAYNYPWEEKQAKRSMAAALQYIGLDTSIKAIGAYAKKLELSESAYKNLSANLVRNYCSKNVTVISLKSIEKSLHYYFANPLKDIIPSVSTSPFAPEKMVTLTESTQARSREFDLLINNFKSFCSWGGDVEDYRLLTPYLNNRFIMSLVIKNMMGLQDKVNNLSKKVESIQAENTAKVVCTDLICRNESAVVFKNNFPRSTGSTGLFTDLSKLYCHHFRYQNPPQNTIPEVKAWIKEKELEDPIFETSNFISLMTGIPDLFSGAENYREIPLLIRSSIDQRWTNWASKMLDQFSKDLLYEESFKVRVIPRRDTVALATEGFKVDFTVTLGEMDRLVEQGDKLGLTFDIKLSKNYLRSLRSRWRVLEREVDEDGKKQFFEEVSQYLNFQLSEKQKLFSYKIWNEDFSRIVGEELLEQVLSYKGPLFDSYRDEVLRVPIQFSYGLFALGYIQYRTDVTRGRLKLNL